MTQPSCERTSLTGPRADAGRAPGHVECYFGEGLVAYPEAVAAMEARVARIANGEAGDCLWFLEHPPLYTAGTSAKKEDLLAPGPLPVYPTGRGGPYTYHGPGQRVVYVMMDIKARGGDVRAFVCRLEAWLIESLAAFGVRAETRAGRVGVWVPRAELGPGREDKIAAIGIRVRRGVTFHGVSLNVAPDLAHFAGIVPCGIADQGVTSLSELGVTAGVADIDVVLMRTFAAAFDVEVGKAAGAVP